VIDTVFAQTNAQGNQIVLGGDCYQDEIGILAANEVTSGCYASVTSLYGLMARSEVVAHNDINMLNLRRHGPYSEVFIGLEKYRSRRMILSSLSTISVVGYYLSRKQASGEA
jgi:hypothetical protein